MLKFVHLNARSLLNKFDEIDLVIQSSNANFFAITETWLSSDIADQVVGVNGYQIVQVVGVNGYQIVRNDRVGRGGGVALYIKNVYRFRVLPIDSHPHLEQLWIETVSCKLPLIVGVFYRPPRSDMALFFDCFSETLADISLLATHLVVY
ncbi:hypothetical protein QE152_g26917 [Popillia japonica]|uniref:Uncharacterized protein n=1 Tax=Popillia japonica TaxID=7064 RepID=A0AAW1JWL9_POPJA